MNRQTLVYLCSSFLLMAVTAGTSFGQQKIGYVDSDYILEKVPEYATIQQSLNKLAQDMQQELNRLKTELQEKESDFAARELLYTVQERDTRKKAIEADRKNLETKQVAYFGPDGQLFDEQNKLMRILQERIFAAMEEVAVAEGFDYLFDISGDFLFMYAREDLNMSNRVLEELGIDVAQGGSGSLGSN